MSDVPNERVTPLTGASLHRSFSSEALLQQALAVLLTRMPDITGVQILQGSQEVGKDLIFYIRGGFGERILCACVVKNSKITGQVDKSRGARTVFFQAQQAFDSVHTDVSGKDIRVERVYVVTPFDLSQETIQSIKGKLQERAGQITFIGGTILFDLFKQFWPDYFADETELIETYLRDAKTNFESENPLKSLGAQYNLGEITNYSKTIYVQQVLFREVYYCELGELLRSKIIEESDYEVAVSKATVDFFISRVNQVRSAIQFLTEWKLCSQSHKEKLFNLSAALISALNEGWRKAEKPLKAYYGIEHRLLLNLPTILNNLSALEECKRESVADLIHELTEARKAIHRCNSLGIEALSNPHYLRACMLDDCARSAPEGIFDRKNAVRICFPKTILENWSKPLLVVGAPGFGKTSFCKWHALQDAERFTTGASTTLPVYVPLYRLSYEPGDSFEKTFLKTLGKSALINNDDSQVNRTVRVYLDGLDEVPSHERRREIVELARKGMDSNKSYQVILTSRDYVYGRWLDSFPRVALGGFEHTDIMELIDKWLGSNTESHKRFCEQIEKMPALRSLMQTPLLATLVVLVFRQTGKLPESRPRLYEIFIDLLSGGWDLAKGVLRESRFGQTVKVMILTALAASLQEHRRREFYGHDLKAVIGSTLSSSMRTQWEGIQYELLIDGLITKSGSMMQFCHHSFQEYLAAKNLLGNPEPIPASRALESYMCGDDWWKEVIVFYIGLSTNPTELASWISNQIRRINSLHYVNLKSSQIQDLRTAVAEAFPNLSSNSVDEIGSGLIAKPTGTDKTRRLTPTSDAK